MTRLFQCVLLVGACAIGNWGLFPSSDAAAGSPDSTEMEVSLDVLEPQPLPFQAARFRLKLRNKGNRRVEGLSPIELSTGVSVRPTTDTIGGIVGVPVLWKPHAGLRRSSRQDKNPIFLPRGLGPGEVESATFAAAGTLVGKMDHKIGEHPLGRFVPLFPYPGEYWVKQNHGLFSNGAEKEQEILVRLVVREPEGDDRAVYDLLRRDGALAGALGWPTLPPVPVLVPRLREIVEKYPKSSYADYARLQLAQHASAVGGPAEVVRHARAASLLEELLPARFPYQPYVWLRFQSLDGRETPRVAALLNRYYPDAMEWLAVRGQLVDVEGQPAMSAEEWAAFRKLRPREWRPNDPDLQPRLAPPVGDPP